MQHIDVSRALNAKQEDPTNLLVAQPVISDQLDTVPL